MNADFRLPVQWVNRPNSDFRGFAGMVAAGSVAPGDAVQVLPGGQEAIVEDIVLSDQSLPRALQSKA